MTTSSQIEGYIKLDGKFVYCDDDADKKCGESVCSTRNGKMPCGNWWGSGYWSGWWNWSYYYGFLGDNLIFLYNEVEAPDEYLCGYPRQCNVFGGWWFGNFFGQYCSEDIGDCNYPRIKSCKTSRCVDTTYSNYYYGYGDFCNTLDGKDRADRCCKKPEDFECKEGECDYDYEIVKKTYSIEYELVKPSYFCSDPPPNVASSCDGGFAANANSSCYEERNYCGPKNKCPQISSDEKGIIQEYYWCDPDATKPSKGYTEMSEEQYQVIWDYPPDDCDTNCTRCIPCDEEDCNFAWYDNYNWGWGYWSYFGTIGSDCCDSSGFGQYSRPQICPTTVTDDGSGNPWWCTGTDCVQMAEGEETVGFTGPFSSRSSCIRSCQDETNKCFAPDPTTTTGLCCDRDFMEKVEKALENECNEQTPRKTQKVKQTLCSGKNCQDSVIFNYSKEICGYQPKYASVTKTVHTKSRKLFSYSPKIPDKNFADYQQCSGSICNEDNYAKCRENFAAFWGGNDCPSNTTRAIITQTSKFNPQEIVGSATVSVVAVFCKVTTKPCVPSEE
jgi:hypothetical protein